MTSTEHPSDAGLSITYSGSISDNVDLDIDNLSLSVSEKNVKDRLPCINEVDAEYTEYIKYMSGPPLDNDYLLSDLPDISDDLPDSQISRGTHNKLVQLLTAHKSPEDIKRYQRRIKREQNARLGQHFVHCMWQQIQHEVRTEGKYQYPIHPSIYYAIKQADKRIESGERENDVYRDLHNTITDLCFDGGKLRKEFRYLYNPPKETRKQCPICLRDGRTNTMRLRMLTSAHCFGTVKYYCQRCYRLRSKHDTIKYWDLWKQYPVFASTYAKEKL